MSVPKTEGEIAQCKHTELQAGPAENVVSTACPECGLRFAMLATFRVTDTGDDMPHWRLRCVNCGAERMGLLTPPEYERVRR
jgi:predicted RNA-binding Zn-ribbon protein involved in translation (DUF1610 family)